MKSSSTMQPRPVELDDVQGIVRFAYKHLSQACFLLLRVKDQAAARAWLAAAPLTSAEKLDTPPATALNVAITSEGMRALGFDDGIVDAFSPEFVAGMAGDANRACRLGDVGANDPAWWYWGASHRVPHVMVMLYARPGGLGELKANIQIQCDTGFEQIACLGSQDMDSREPFGFMDGISQPEVDWERKRTARDEQCLDYINLTCLGEFLLGYPNEYGAYTDRPLLAPDAHLPSAEDQPDKADLGRNGSYLVMRQLQQDVQGFWRYLDRQARGDGELRERLAAAMLGRTLDGEPLIAAPAEAANAAQNAFDYRSDPLGVRCPLGAHIRRANPRTGDLPPGGSGIVSRLIRTFGFADEALANDLVASTRFHRLLRRGRDYGAKQSIEDALDGSAINEESGLHFICLGANIARQFEFVQGAWMSATKFNGLKSERDPLLGHRAPGPAGTPSDVFSLPQRDGPDQQLCGVPQFVTVRGGAYFFLPGIRALRYLASAR